MTKEELARKDPTFSSELFITKANLMIKKILYAITLKDLAKVDHFISDNVYNKIIKQMENANLNGYDLVYDEINVNTTIKDIKEQNNSYQIITNVTIKCLRYLKAKEDKKIIESNIINNNRITLNKRIVFKKVQNIENRDTNRCRGCGTTYNINDSGICPVCGRIFDLEKIDYYIDEFE